MGPRLSCLLILILVSGCADYSGPDNAAYKFYEAIRTGRYAEVEQYLDYQGVILINAGIDDINGKDYQLVRIVSRRFLTAEGMDKAVDHVSQPGDCEMVVKEQDPQRSLREVFLLVRKTDYAWRVVRHYIRTDWDVPQDDGKKQTAPESALVPGEPTPIFQFQLHKDTPQERPRRSSCGW